MERIGLAASKIAKGNLFFYNFFVILLTLLIAFFVYFVAGSAIVVGLILIAYLSAVGGVPDLSQNWIPLMTVPLGCLAIVVGLFALCALARNLRFKK